MGCQLPCGTEWSGSIMVSKYKVGYERESETEWFMSYGERILKR